MYLDSSNQLILGRLSYFCNYYSLLDEYLINIGQKPLDYTQTWISYNKVGLKWHYSVGLLYDLHNSPAVWNLEIHETGYPDDIFRWDHENCMFDLWMSMIKEADQLRNGSIAKIMGLSTSDHLKLWSSIEKRTWN